MSVLGCQSCLWLLHAIQCSQFCFFVWIFFEIYALKVLILSGRCMYVFLLFQSTVEQGNTNSGTKRTDTGKVRYIILLNYYYMLKVTCMIIDRQSSKAPQHFCHPLLKVIKLSPSSYFKPQISLNWLVGFIVELIILTNHMSAQFQSLCLEIK